MRSTLKIALALTFLSNVVFADDKPTQHITRAAEHVVNQAPASNFSGSAHFSRFPTMPSDGDVAPAIVTFSPNTITNWHIHPSGQYLIVIDGEGRTQEWSKSIHTIHKGDVVWCPPGVKHWHGASVHSGMTHIVIAPVLKEDEKVIWLEKVEFPEAAEAKKSPPQKIASGELTQKQLSLIPIAAFTATGDFERLTPALVKGLDSGLSVNEHWHTSMLMWDFHAV